MDTLDLPLSRAARVVWCRVFAALMILGRWTPEMACVLDTAAHLVADYVSIVERRGIERGEPGRLLALRLFAMLGYTPPADLAALIEDNWEGDSDDA